MPNADVPLTAPGLVSASDLADPNPGILHPGGAVPRRPIVSPPGMRGRRLLFAALVLVTIGGLLTLFVRMAAPGGLHPAEGAMILCFAITLPWTVIGFWNAVIGLAVMRLSRDPIRTVAPYLKSEGDDGDTPGAPWEGDGGTRTAVAMCVRNEDAQSVASNLLAMAEDLIALRAGGDFTLYVLSDSNRADVIVAEEAAFEALRSRLLGRIPLVYRRRAVNTGFKAGNIEDFCDRFGHLHRYALVLDADSLMAGRTILRMIAVMEANPEIGILQHLTAGRPADSLFTRVFQFGMRLGMRSYTLGSAWWQGDCGPYWGHNAVIRLAPFTAHCRLPDLPGEGPLGGKILSHDQVEAVLMRRAGYEVRVLPVDEGSWEENPPHLLEFIRRDLRWCQGNLQYLKLLGLPGLPTISRYQLVLAILMFVGSPAWLAMIAISAGYFSTVEDVYAEVDPAIGAILTAVVMTMVFAPKFATMADVLVDRARRRAFGGRIRILLGVAGETVFSMLLAPVMASMHTIFIARLIAGYGLTWESQNRRGVAVAPRMALRRLWGPTVLGGAGLMGAALMTWPSGLFLLPVLAGMILAIPFAVVTSLPSLGRVSRRLGAWRVPEEADGQPVGDLPQPVADQPTNPLITAPVPAPGPAPSGRSGPMDDTPERPAA